MTTHLLEHLNYLLTFNAEIVEEFVASFVAIGVYRLPRGSLNALVCCKRVGVEHRHPMLLRKKSLENHKNI